MNNRIIAAYAVNVIGREEYAVNNIIFGANDDLDVELLERIAQLMQNNVIPKLDNFYEAVIPSYNLSTFKSDFRMTPTAFEFILSQIAYCPEFVRRDRTLFGGKDQINIEKALLIAIWTLATPECYRSVASRFNVGKSTIFTCLHTIVDIILKYLLRLFLKWPSDQEKEIISRQFNRYGLDNVIGAIDGCHIPIKKPTVHGEDYFNRKKFYSMVLQAVCQNNLMFTDVDVRWPGSVHDARVFRNSDIYQLGPVLCAPVYFILGDAAYPCKNWIITPFRDNGHLTPQQRFFNTQLSKTRVKIEQSFGLLLGRFRRLKDYLDMYDIHRIVKTICACCVLHNICILQGDEDIENYIREGLQNMVLLNPDPQENNNNNDGGFALRSHIAQQLWNRRNMINN